MRKTLQVSNISIESANKLRALGYSLMLINKTARPASPYPAKQEIAKLVKPPPSKSVEPAASKPHNTHNACTKPHIVTNR